MKFNHSLRTSGHVRFATWSLGLSAASLISAAHAATLTWDASGANPVAPTDGPGTWDTTVANWSNGAADIAWPDTASDVAVFGANNGAAGSITVDTVTANGITFNAAGSGTYELAGGMVTLDGTTPTLTANADATIASAIAGTVGLTKAGTGVLTLSGNNFYSGGTAVTAGTLTVKQPGTAVGTVVGQVLGADDVSINPSGTLYIDDEGNGTTGGERILSVGNTITGTGTLQTRASSVHTAGWSSVNFTGDLSGFTGSLNILAGSTTNRGKVKFTAASQAAVLSSSATVDVANGAQLYLTQAYNYGFGIHLNGGTGGENNGSLRLDNAMLDVTGGVTLHADSIISGSGKISGAIGQTGGSYRLTKVGNNVTVLTGPNTYGGGTTISAGTVSVGNDTALGSGAVTIGGGNLSNTTGVTLANNFTLNNASTFTAGSGTMTLNGNITGNPTGNWNLTATNKITLAGTNSITSTGNFAGLIVTGVGGLDVTGSTTVTGAVANQQSGYLSLAGNSTIAVKSTGSLAINGTTHASFPNSIVGQNAAGTSTLAVEGGSLTIGGNTGFALGNNVATATGVLTVSSGTATINRGSTTATDIRSFIALGRDLASGTVNLNGGILATDRNFVRDSSGGANGGTANFVFGGGTLKALADQADWLNSSLINTNQQALSSVTTTSAASTIDPNGFSVGINNAISGGGGFNINSSTGTGTGTVTFTGTNTYTGDTTVTAGILAVDGDAIADANKLVINGGKVDPMGATEVVGTLYFGASQQAAGTWGSTASGATHQNDTHFTGTGVVSVTTGASVGGFTSWSNANGATGQTMDQDHDNDGVVNGVEYFMGQTGSTFTANPAPAGGTVAWPMGATYTGVYGTDYEVQYSTDLVFWTQAPIGTGDNTVTVYPGPTPARSVAYDAPSGGKSFVRLVVTN